MAKMHTPAMEKIERKNAKRKKPRQITPSYEAWKRFRRNPTALVGLIIVAVLILIAIFAPLIAPYNYQSQDYAAADASMAPDILCLSLFSVRWRRCSAAVFSESSPDISAVR